MDKWIKPLGFLIIFILLCSVIGRLLTKGETLADYADQNPEIAYATPQKTQEPSPSPTPTPLPSPSPSPSPSPELPPFVPLDTESGESTHYQEGFFYQPLSDAVTARITGISYPVSESIAPALSLQAVNVIPDAQTPAISYSDLRYMNILYYDFQGDVQVGELICNKDIAQDLVEIFYELYLNQEMKDGFKKKF